MKNIAKVMAPSRKPTTFAPVSVRNLAKIPSGTSGAFECSSTNTNSACRTAEAARTPSVWAEPQPTTFARVSA